MLASLSDRCGSALERVHRPGEFGGRTAKPDEQVAMNERPGRAPRRSYHRGAGEAAPLSSALSVPARSSPSQRWRRAAGSATQALVLASAVALEPLSGSRDRSETEPTSAKPRSSSPVDDGSQVDVHHVRDLTCGRPRSDGRPARRRPISGGGTALRDAAATAPHQLAAAAASDPQAQARGFERRLRATIAEAPCAGRHR